MNPVKSLQRVVKTELYVSSIHYLLSYFISRNMITTEEEFERRVEANHRDLLQKEAGFGHDPNASFLMSSIHRLILGPTLVTR